MFLLTIILRFILDERKTMTGLLTSSSGQTCFEQRKGIKMNNIWVSWYQEMELFHCLFLSYVRRPELTVLLIPPISWSFALTCQCHVSFQQSGPSSLLSSNPVLSSKHI